MNLYGLIGYPLSHSFSQRYFREKFEKEGLDRCFYQLFPIGNISELLVLLNEHHNLRGFNVTIPYKEQIIAYLDELDIVAEKTGAVNTVQVIRSGKVPYLKGYNTDVYGFTSSLQEWFKELNREFPKQALVLGTGGASKAVVYALNTINVKTNIVSRKTPLRTGEKNYELLNAEDIAANKLIINTTPLGMFPDINGCPAIPYSYLSEEHYLYDLVYNPEETLFMHKGNEIGASVKNGARMLHLQADKAWEIWSNYYST